MWRALFLAIGIFGVVLGLECLVIDRAVLYERETLGPRIPGLSAFQQVRSKEIVPPDWAPWSLISFGVVTVIYSFTIPKRVGG